MAEKIDRPLAGGLTAVSNPAARMQELLRRPVSPEGPATGSNEGNNEGNFIVSELPPKETPKQERSGTPKEKRGQVSEVAPGGVVEKTRKVPSETTPKIGSMQSLRNSVLEDDEKSERVSKTRLNVDIDEDLHFWLKTHAIQNRRKLNDLIPRILKAYRDEVEADQ